MQMSRMNHPRVPVPPVRRHHFIPLFIQNISAFIIFGRWRNIPSNRLLSILLASISQIWYQSAGEAI